jgi:ankyrin repeat protein
MVQTETRSKNVNNYNWQQLAELATCKTAYSFIKLLAEEPALARFQNRQGCTLLTHTCSNGKVLAVKALLEARAEPNGPADALRSPLTAAAPNHKSGAQIIELLIAKRADPNAPGSAPLIIAASSGNRLAVQALLKGGAKVNSLCNRGLTALTHACDNGSAAIVQDLIEAKADVHTQCSPPHRMGESNALFAAASSCKSDGRIIDLLVAKGVNVNVVDGTYTPLFWAVINENHNVVTSLLKHSADVNMKVRNGKTALMPACRTGSVRMIHSLLEAGADPNIVDRTGQDSFDYALHNDFSTQINQLLSDKYEREKTRPTWSLLGTTTIKMCQVAPGDTSPRNRKANRWF